MKREDIERKLDTAVSGMIPKDMFDRISENIVSANPKAIERVIKRKRKRTLIFLAEALWEWQPRLVYCL